MKIAENKKPLQLRWFESEMARLWEETHGCDAAYVFGHPKGLLGHGTKTDKIETYELAMRRPPSPWFFEFGKNVFPKIVHPASLPKFNHRFSFFVAYSDAISEAVDKYEAWRETSYSAFRTYVHAFAKKLPDANEKLDAWLKIENDGCK